MSQNERDCIIDGKANRFTNMPHPTEPGMRIVGVVVPATIFDEGMFSFGMVKETLFKLLGVKLPEPKIAIVPYWEDQCPECGGKCISATRGIPQVRYCVDGHDWVRR